jgi:uncharacterized membrane protein
MKSENNNEELRNIILAIALVMGFTFLVSFFVFYVKDRYGVNKSCSCGMSLTLIIVALASLGVFVGTLTYYFLSKSLLKNRKIDNNKKDIELTYNFLDTEERKIIKAIINSKNKISQNKLSKITEIDPVKLSRRISSLEEKDIILKEKNGMTNTIKLKLEIYNLFKK